KRGWRRRLQPSHRDRPGDKRTLQEWLGLGVLVKCSADPCRFNKCFNQVRPPRFTRRRRFPGNNLTEANKQPICTLNVYHHLVKGRFRLPPSGIRQLAHDATIRRRNGLSTRTKVTCARSRTTFRRLFYELFHCTNFCPTTRT